MSHVLMRFIQWHPYAALFLWSGWMMIAILPFYLLGMRRVWRMGQKIGEKIRLRQKNLAPLPWPTVAPITPLTSWERRWRRAGWRRRVPPLRLVGATIIIVSVATLIGEGIFGFIGILGIFSLGYWFLSARAAKYQTVLVKQLPDGLMSLAGTIRSGLSWPQAVVFGAQEFDPPLKEVFQALGRGLTWQLDYDTALEHVTVALNIPEWTMVTEIIRSGQDFGGNIVPLLEATAQSVRDRLNIEREIKTMTAAGRMSGILIASLMPIVTIVFWFISPNYLELLFITALGRLLFVTACLLEIVGFLWIRQVVTVDY